MIIRDIEEKDIEDFYKIKCEDHNIFWTGWDSKPKYENIKDFIIKSIENKNEKLSRKVYVIEDNKSIVGYMYLIPINNSDFDLPVALKYESVVKAKDVIKEGLLMAKKIGYKRLIGYIREDNIFSMKAYKNNGAIITNEYIEKYIPMLKKKIKLYKIEITL